MLLLLFFWRCGPLIDLCRGPHVRHTGKIKALKIHKVKQPESCSWSDRVRSPGPCIISFMYMSHVHPLTNDYCCRIRPRTGRARPTWRHCSASMAFPSQTPKCWRSGRNSKRKLRTEITVNWDGYGRHRSRNSDHMTWLIKQFKQLSR